VTDFPPREGLANFIWAVERHYPGLLHLFSEGKVQDDALVGILGEHEELKRIHSVLEEIGRDHQSVLERHLQERMEARLGQAVATARFAYPLLAAFFLGVWVAQNKLVTAECRCGLISGLH
jgi:hypothetical protein